MKLKLMHTMDGKPATYLPGEQICFAASGKRSAISLVDSMAQIREQRKFSSKRRKLQGFDPDDNMADRHRKGRFPTRFNGHVRAKLTGTNLREFLGRVGAGESAFNISPDFGIHGATGCKIDRQLFQKP